MGAEWPFVSDVEEIQAHYELCRRNHCAHALAEMLAFRAFPGTVGTDRAFMQGRLHQTGGQQFERLPRWVGEQYVQQALAAGVNPTGKYYSGSLARYPGDPRAWIDSLGDVRRVAAERGLSVQGAVTIEPPEAPSQSEPAPYRVAPDIVQAKVAERLAEQPELASKREEVTYEVSKTLAGVHGQ